MTKIVAEGIYTPSTEDGGMAKYGDIDPIEEEIFFRIQSWDETKKHLILSPFIGKRVRVTLETIE